MVHDWKSTEVQREAMGCQNMTEEQRDVWLSRIPRARYSHEVEWLRVVLERSYLRRQEQLGRYLHDR